MKKILRSLRLWWSSRTRRPERAERVRTRTRDAVQEEMRRRELELPETTGSLTSRFSRRASSITRSFSSWVSTKEIGTQTVAVPVIPLE